MNTTAKADVIAENKNNSNEGNGRDNRDSTDSNQLSHRHQAGRFSALMQPPSTCEINLEFDKDDIHKAAERTTGVYYNNSVALKKSKVSVDGLVEYVDSLTQDDIKAEFENFPQGLIKPYVYSKRSENMPRNRYKGIYPYDDCRVKIRDGDTDYINARPMSQQLGGEFEPFWRMTTKCEQYWPNVGISKMYGEFRITCHSEDMYAEFTRRALTIAKDKAECIQ
ncbi:PTN4-like protein [Mya arenaria]|uniref:PTN4-like protein n=1 Tax=Mya arenaria TaxID=6604 RepID=A0ABY7F5P7_MYAAR|nr:PTN4-like protein [Mya arenaria]